MKSHFDRPLFRYQYCVLDDDVRLRREVRRRSGPDGMEMEGEVPEDRGFGQYRADCDSVEVGWVRGLIIFDYIDERYLLH